ncbi:MAG: hypothetical protein GC150_02695 [Rhizobiales bacterium]|nr:hypothetical protein [Hyphomicrobiales bacterium]
MRHYLTSSRIDAKNDTGRIAYCGPYVVSAITGFSISRIEEAIRAYRSELGDAEEVIEGTTTDELRAALEVFGYGIRETENHMELEPRERPTVWSWMQRPRSAWKAYILAIHHGRDGHWITVKGTKISDSFTEGKWVFVTDGPHRGRRIMEVYEVARLTSVPSMPTPRPRKAGA